ncbi:hypothetical protein Ate01nite_41970 [Actinoplanes teichomyceticus]|nr:hypothetical protein Ate01nite_41970 [Actinoplanes teichomyceticus]
MLTRGGAVAAPVAGAVTGGAAEVGGSGGCPSATEQAARVSDRHPATSVRAMLLTRRFYPLTEPVTSRAAGSAGAWAVPFRRGRPGGAACRRGPDP